MTDLESLPFASESLDLVYSSSVSQHGSNIAGAIDETWRVLRYGREVKIMIYHKDLQAGWETALRGQDVVGHQR